MMKRRGSVEVPFYVSRTVSSVPTDIKLGRLRMQPADIIAHAGIADPDAPMATLDEFFGSDSVFFMLRVIHVSPDIAVQILLEHQDMNGRCHLLRRRPLHMQRIRRLCPTGSEDREA